MLSICTFIPAHFPPLHSTSTCVLLSPCLLHPWLLWADHVSVKVCDGSGTAWDVSALWCPGLRRPPLPFIRSASDPLTPPPGTRASVPASQAQFYFPLPHMVSSSGVPHLLTVSLLNVLLCFEWRFKIFGHLILICLDVRGKLQCGTAIWGLLSMKFEVI